MRQQMLPFVFNLACMFQRRQFPRQMCWLDHIKMFCLEHETMNVCQRNVARFVHVDDRFDKLKDIYQGFGSQVSLRLQKDGGVKSKQIWTNL